MLVPVRRPRGIIRGKSAAAPVLAARVVTGIGHTVAMMATSMLDQLQAADNHVLYRETVRGVAFRKGLWASLAPKPIPDQASNGARLHLSLRDIGPDGAPGDEAVFCNSEDRYQLSETGYHFIGGLLAYLPALTALTCGSVNSYRRLAPQMWSSAHTVYGMDNREAAVRICSPMRDDPAASVNLELKPSGTSANPYLALGACVHAGPGGIRRKLHPGEAVNVDPATLSDTERLARGAHRLPDSLTAALDALEADELLMESLGDLRRRAYLAVSGQRRPRSRTATPPANASSTSAESRNKPTNRAPQIPSYPLTEETR